MTAEFTTDQVAAIRMGVIAGRSAMEQRGVDALIFAGAFIASGGIQIPGREVPDPIKRRVGSCVLMSLSERSVARYPFNDPQWAFDAVVREMNRALSEAYWFGSMKNPDIVGFRIVIADNVADRRKCESFSANIDHGLGPGIYPKRDIAVLPTCCDRAFLEVVFSDEV